MTDPKEYAKELRRQAVAFESLAKILKVGDPNSKQLMNAAVCKGLAEVCLALAGLQEAEGDG